MNQNNNISIICELASAHGGDPVVLKKMMVSADKAGSDWIKVQIYKFDQLVSEESGKFSDLKTIEIAGSSWLDIVDFTASLKSKLIVEVFDLESLNLVANNKNVHAFKIPTADLSDKEFVSAVCEIGKPMFIGVGGASIEEIDSIVSQVNTYQLPIVLMHGFQNFPTKLEDSLLNKRPLLRERYNCPVGFAAHIDAEEGEMARVLPSMAVAAGATIIEKHMTLNRSKKGFDYYSSLNPDEFSIFTQHIRIISRAVSGDDLSILNPAETAYRNNMKKFATLDQDVKKGEVVNDINIIYRRTAIPGLTRKQMELFRGKQFSLNYSKGVVVNEQCFN